MLRGALSFIVILCSVSTLECGSATKCRLQQIFLKPETLHVPKAHQCFWEERGTDLPG